MRNRKSSYSNPELKKGVLSPIETIAQSIGCIAPTAAPAIAISITFLHTGEASWLAFAIATIMMLLIALNIVQFAKSSNSPGSLYSYTTKGLGKSAGIIAGLSLMAAYIGCASATLCETTMFFNNVINSIWHISINPIFGIFFFASIIAYIAYKNIELSARTMLWLEMLSIALIIGLFACFIFISKPDLLDGHQLVTGNLNSEGLHLALIIAIFSFVGFESACSLGKEARAPRKTIPTAVISSTIFSGVFFVLSAYIMIIAAKVLNIDLAHCSTPLSAMAGKLDLPAVGILTSIGAGISLFGAGLACINASSRILYTMANDGVLARALNKVHSKNKTPFIAVFLAISIATLIAISLSGINYPVLEVVGWLGSFGTYGFIMSYLLISIGASVYLKKRGRLGPLNVVLSILSTMAVCYALIGIVYPVPPAPYSYLPYLFMAYLAGGFIFCKCQSSNSEKLTISVSSLADHSDAKQTPLELSS